MELNADVYELIRQEIISFIVGHSPDGDVVDMCEIAPQDLANRYPILK